MRVLTHAGGTGYSTVRHVLTHLGAVVYPVHSVTEAHTTPADAVILLGGSDINPRYYGQEPRHAQRPDSDRDRIEWALARRAILDELPLLGICRGHQMLAVAHGGQLHQDVVRDGATHTRHTGTRHALTRVDRRLAKYLPTTTVNSLHHQAVISAPPSLRVMAVSEDGLIESLWRPGVLGVQWHPELMVTDDARWVGLFRWFIEGLN